MGQSRGPPREQIRSTCVLRRERRRMRHPELLRLSKISIAVGEVTGGKPVSGYQGDSGEELQGLMAPRQMGAVLPRYSTNSFRIRIRNFVVPASRVI